MRRVVGWKKLVLAGGAIVLGVAGAAFGLRGRPGAAPATSRPLEAAENAARPLAIAAAAAARNPVATVPVRLVKLAGDIQLVGTVSYDHDHLAVVGPLVPGRVARLHVGVGDHVRRGQVLGEIESADVGQARADFISARARAAASEANLRRENELAERRISSAREREVAEAQWIAERAAQRAATERLRAIGFSPSDIAAIETRGEGGRVAMRAPLDGIVLRRAVTLGQAVERATDAFQIADTAHVWVELDLYEKDLPRVRGGQRVEIRADAYPSEAFGGRVALVVPLVDQATRTAKVRIELANPTGKLSFGQLVSARILGDPAAVASSVLAVPRAAVQRVEGRTLVFVKSAGAFVRRQIETGAQAGDEVEVRSGLSLGDEVAADGAFLLKSELLR
jgi:cobalt-zinc-cadmium efflux system membrane fusion protein